MLIPIGFFGAGGASGSMELISTTLISTNTASVTFDVSTLASTYKHLQLRATVRNSDTTYQHDFLKLQFNSDTATNYSYHELLGNGSAVSSTGGTSTDNIMAAHITTNGYTASGFSAVVFDLLDPFSTSKYKTTRSLSGYAGSTNRIFLNSGSWRSTSAVTSLKFYTSGSLNFVSGCRFSLYGIKGA